MLGQPAGWHRDPAPRDPFAPDTWRWWDGTSWTAQTRTGTKQERRTWRAEAVAAGAPSLGATTADGDRLAGWWARVAATLLDGVVTTVVGALVAWPFLREVGAAYGELLTASVDAARTGAAGPTAAAFLERAGGSLLATSVIFLLVSLVYEVGLLKGYQATLGKMLLGLEVRPGHARGPLTWQAALLRWTGKGGVGVLQWVPFGALLHGLYWLADHLWPLRDPQRQALHDKLARTCVVRRA